MPTTEINAHLKYRNTSGDTTVIYPITRADNIEGILPITSGGTGASDAATARANLGAAPVFTYGIDDVVAGSTSEEPDGTIHFVYTTEDGIWDYVKAVFISIDGVWRLICNTSNTGSSGDSGGGSSGDSGGNSSGDSGGNSSGGSSGDSGGGSSGDSGTVQTYTITANLSMVTGASSNPTTIAKNGTATLTFTADGVLTLPDYITVSGATYTWDKSTGVLTLSNPTGNVTINIAAAYSIRYYLTGATGASSNPTTIAKNGTVTLTFTANTGYTLPDSVTVSGATYEWNKSTGVLTLSNPTGNVTVVIAAAYTTSITYYLDGTLVTTKTVTSTGSYLTATAVSKSGATATVTLSDGSTDSYTYSANLVAVEYTHNDSGSILISAFTTAYTTYVKYYLDGSLKDTHTITHTEYLVLPVGVSTSGKIVTVEMANNSTDSYTYGTTVESATYENNHTTDSSVTTSVYAISQSSSTTTYATVVKYYLDGSLKDTHTITHTEYLVLPVGVSTSGKIVTVEMANNSTDSYTYGTTVESATYENNHVSDFYTITSVYAYTDSSEAIYDTFINYYLDGTLVTTKTVTSTGSYLTATAVSKSGATATVTLSDGSTDSYTYSANLSTVSYENSPASYQAIAVYATT